MAKPKAQAGGQTTQNQDSDDEDDGPQFVTVEQLNAAIAGKLNDFTKKLPKLLEAPLSDFGSKLLEGFRGQAGAVGTPEAPKEDSALRKSLEETRAAMAKMEEDRKREQAQVRREKARGMLEAGLTAAKVHPKLLPAAVRLLEDNLGEDDGRIVFKRTNAYGLEETVSVDEAVKSWAKSEDGKTFIMAPTTKGSGAPPRAAAPSKAPSARQEKSTPEDSEAARVAKAKAVLLNEFLGLGGGDDSDDE